MNILFKLIRATKRAQRGLMNRGGLALGYPLRPKQLVYMVTDQCNSRCVHCGIWQNKHGVSLLTPLELERALSDPLFAGVRYVICTGGEPTLRIDLEEVILAIHRSLPRAVIQLSSNGLLPERVIQIAQMAIEQGFPLDVGLSLDGIGPAHDQIRGVQGGFTKTDRLIRELIVMRKSAKAGLTVSAGIVISDLTLHSLGEVRNYASEVDIPLTEAWYNVSMFYENRDRLLGNREMMDAVRSQPPSPLQELWMKTFSGKAPDFPCFAMHTFCVIKADGSLSPCLNLWNDEAGNIRTASASSIWRSHEAEMCRKKVKDCKGCLNSWGAGWSLTSSYNPIAMFYLKHPRLLMGELQHKVNK